MKKTKPKLRVRQRRKSAQVMRLRRQMSRQKARVHRKKRFVRRDQPTLLAPSHFILMGKDGWQGNDVRSYFDFLSKLRMTKTSELVIDMSEVRRMVVDATLLFKAELSNLVQSKGVRIKAILPNRSRTLQVLKQTGLDILLNAAISIAPEREDVVHWRVAEGPGSQVDPVLLEPIMADIEAATGLAAHPIYQGIIESMSNCVEHAYRAHPDVTRAMPNSPGWWVFQQVRDDTLAVQVCDLGIGISRALPLTLANEEGLLKKLLHLARRAKGSDNRALLAAMEYGRSGTGQHERGKGMRNAHAVVDDMGAGHFFAMSNRGLYIYTRVWGDPVGKKQSIRLKDSINGTIMGWRLPLKPLDARSTG